MVSSPQRTEMGTRVAVAVTVGVGEGLLLGVSLGCAVGAVVGDSDGRAILAVEMAVAVLAVARPTVGVSWGIARVSVAVDGGAPAVSRGWPFAVGKGEGAMVSAKGPRLQPMSARHSKPKTATTRP